MLTRRQLWAEYQAKAQGGKAYTYSRFCGLLKTHLHDQLAQMRFHYEPGLYGLSDFSGKTLALRTGRGETDVEIFVAVLAYSNLTYTEAVPDQSLRHWIMAHRRAFEYFGGVPARWIIDNLKAGVDNARRPGSIRASPSSPGIIMSPCCRRARPTDKGLVEAAVGTVQSRILLALRHEAFFSLDAMNAAIRRELDRFNEALMACGQTRPVRSYGAAQVLAPDPLGMGRVGRTQGRPELPCPDRLQSLLRARAPYRAQGPGPRR